MTTPRHESVYDRLAGINKPTDWDAWLLTNYAIDVDNYAANLQADPIKWKFNGNSLEAAMYRRLLNIPGDTWGQTEIMTAFSLGDAEWLQFSEIFSNLNSGNATAILRNWTDWGTLNFLVLQGHWTEKTQYYNRYGVTTADVP